MPFDALRDAHLPAVDALYIGGGFPETCAAELEANAALRGEIKRAIDNGMPAYAECGGLMYLSRSIEYQGRTYQMVGAIPGRCEDARQTGRTRLRASQGRRSTSVAAPPCFRKNPLLNHSPASGESEARGRSRARKSILILAHEFHYSSLENLPPDTRFAYHVERGYGIDGKRDGLDSAQPAGFLYPFAHHRQLLLGDPLRRFHPAAIGTTRATSEHSTLQARQNQYDTGIFIKPPSPPSTRPTRKTRTRRWPTARNIPRNCSMRSA